MAYDYSGYYPKTWETSIRTAFNNAGRNLDDKKRDMLRDIDIWRGDFIREMDNYIHGQKALVEEEYRRKKTEIDSDREQYLNLARQYDFDKKENEIERLIRDCRDFKSELGKLEDHGPAIPFIQFLTEGQLKEKKINESKREKKGDNTPWNNPNKDSGSNTDGYRNTSGQQTSTAFFQMKQVALLIA